MGLAPCTVRNYWRICETQQSWEHVLLAVSAAGARCGARRFPVSVNCCALLQPRRTYQTAQSDYRWLSWLPPTFV